MGRPRSRGLKETWRLDDASDVANALVDGRPLEVSVLDQMNREFVGYEHKRPTLLIADDDPVVRSMLGMSLDQRFEIVGAVEDSDQAIQVAKERQPDAALIDVDMPGGGGDAAVRGIAQASPQTAIVVLLADESDPIVRDLLQAGAMTYRRKGITSQELSETLESSIRALRQEQAAVATSPSDR